MASVFATFRLGRHDLAAHPHADPKPEYEEFLEHGYHVRHPGLSAQDAAATPEGQEKPRTAQRRTTPSLLDVLVLCAPTPAQMTSCTPEISNAPRRSRRTAYSSSRPRGTLESRGATRRDHRMYADSVPPSNVSPTYVRGLVPVRPRPRQHIRCGGARRHPLHPGSRGEPVSPWTRRTRMMQLRLRTVPRMQSEADHHISSPYLPEPARRAPFAGTWEGGGPRARCGSASTPSPTPTCSAVIPA
ncbi:hypothetical protein BC628DRAFT_461449 [Trametes gibbosa]|nr:hypothetical protein BC628DRAFT_461449 [Trametes gibbosa]